jgi:4-hydroxybenzoate polyprenyltransferase
MKKNIIHYLKAIRPHFAIYLIEIILGAFISVNFNLSLIPLSKFIIILISFQLLYSGIYINNDLFDFNYDRLNPRKLNRPIASGRIQRKKAFIFSLILISLAIILAYNTSVLLIYFEIFFLIYNLIYSTFFKKIPYIDTLSGGVTHSARFILGYSLFNPFNFYALAICFSLFHTGIFLIIRLKEIKYKEKVNRPIKHYSKLKIKIFWISIMIIMLILTILSNSIERIIIILILALYTLIITLYLKNSFFRKLSEKLSCS